MYDMTEGLKGQLGLGRQMGHLSLPVPTPSALLRSRSSSFPGLSPLSQPRRPPLLSSPPLLLITTYCYCAHLRPPLTLSLSLSALKGITAIVATERAGHCASSAIHCRHCYGFDFFLSLEALTPK